mmetsp:Transcript_1178/g.2720  ORF Transcript_1178/g.2720 Transcript_1178/m.2720 type:complete len:245 (-) Transcript_1178:2222-2956(-)
MSRRMSIIKCFQTRICWFGMFIKLGLQRMRTSVIIAFVVINISHSICPLDNWSTIRDIIVAGWWRLRMGNIVFLMIKNCGFDGIGRIFMTRWRRRGQRELIEWSLITLCRSFGYLVIIRRRRLSVNVRMTISSYKFPLSMTIIVCKGRWRCIVKHIVVDRRRWRGWRRRWNKINHVVCFGDLVWHGTLRGFGGMRIAECIGLGLGRRSRKLVEFFLLLTIQLSCCFYFPLCFDSFLLGQRLCSG